MYIKVCGLTSPEQVAQISCFADYVGFIFFKESKRYVEHSSPSMKAKKTGVFVNESYNRVLASALWEKLDAIQLHGDEAPEFCAAFNDQLEVIKAFGIDEDFDFEKLKEYVDYVDYFLFDNKCSGYGGSGRQFDWSLLDKYQLDTPFFLSGGLNMDSLEELKKINHPKFIGVDLNSGFEIEPGTKNIEQLKYFIDELRSHQLHKA